MRIARTGQYALQALLELAGQDGLTVGEIAARTGVPEPFLHQLVAPLRQAGLVTAKRGPGGGLFLAAPAESISMMAVLGALGLEADVSESEWTRILPDPHRSRLENIERILPDELGMLTLGDLMLSENAAAHPSTTAISDLLPPRRLLDYVGQHAVAVTQSQRCAIYFGGENFGYVTTAIETRGDVPVTLPESSETLTSHWVPYRPVGAVAAAWLTGRQVVIRDTHSDSRADPMIATRFRIRSVLATPIHAGADGSGVLVVAMEQPNAWEDWHLQRASELATIAGFAIVGHSQISGAGQIQSSEAKPVALQHSTVVSPTREPTNGRRAKKRDY